MNSSVMIDIETAGTNKDACILTIAAHMFDPFSDSISEKHLYKRVNIDSQTDRSIDDSTIEWWSKQPKASLFEAFEAPNRFDLQPVLEELSRFIFHCDFIWANGVTFDMNILEDAYRSYKMPLPWKYSRVRDCRTVYSLYPNLERLPASHNSLEDCQRQIVLLQKTFKFLNIKKIV